jgi:hypothetical protein
MSSTDPTIEHRLAEIVGSAPALVIAVGGADEPVKMAATFAANDIKAAKRVSHDVLRNPLKLALVQLGGHLAGAPDATHDEVVHSLKEALAHLERSGAL